MVGQVFKIIMKLVTISGMVLAVVAAIKMLFGTYNHQQMVLVV